MFLQFLCLIGFSGSVLLESSSEANHEICANISLDNCLKDLKTFLKLTQLPFTSKKIELEELCSQAIRGYNCSMDALASNCLTEKQKTIILPLFLDMAQYTQFMFCEGYETHGYLEKAFLKHSGCITEHKSQMECCARETRVPDIPALRILQNPNETFVEKQKAACCPLSRYAECVTEVINNTCGDAAANFTYEYVIRASGEQLQGVCQRMPGYPDTETEMCPEPSPKCSRSWIMLPNYVSIILSILLLKILSDKR